MTDKTEIFKAVSEPNRVRILLMLLDKPLCVCEITSILKLSTATVSNHLSYLKQIGFVSDRKDGKWINYQIKEDIDNTIILTILDNLKEWFKNETDIINDNTAVKTVDRYSIICNGKTLS